MMKKLCVMLTLIYYLLIKTVIFIHSTDMSKLTDLSDKFKDHLGKTAARSKPKTSRKQVLKRIDKSKATYQVERKKLKNLERNLKKIENDINLAKGVQRTSRSDMLKLKKVLSNMDLADCNYVILYEDSNECGYIVDGEERSLDVDDDGELSFKLMKEYRKEKRQAEKDAQNARLAEETADEKASESNSVSDEEEEGKEEEDENSAEDDFTIPNLRFLEE